MLLPRLRAVLAAVALAGLTGAGAGAGTGAATALPAEPPSPGAAHDPTPVVRPAPRALDVVAAAHPPAPAVVPAAVEVAVEPLPRDPESELDPRQVERLMIAAGFPPEEVGVGVAITQEESGRVPAALNTRAAVGDDRGLWQINDHYWEDELAAGDWRDPAHNTRLAHLVWTRQGWDAWVTYDAEAMDGLPPPSPGR